MIVKRSNMGSNMDIVRSSKILACVVSFVRSSSIILLFFLLYLSVYLNVRLQGLLSLTFAFDQFLKADVNFHKTKLILLKL